MNKKQTSELHPIKNESRPRPVKNKKGGFKNAFRAKHHRRAKQVAAVLSSTFLLVGTTLGVASLFGRADVNEVDKGFVSVSYERPIDGSLPTDHSALENFGYLNNTFKQQTSIYSEMHGTTVANAVGLNISQSVNTYKQFNDGILIMVDMTTSSMVNAARQFCYVGDDVLWRESDKSTKSTWATDYATLSTMEWKNGEPYAHMSVSDFQAKNGLPGTEFSVYVVNEHTLMDAEEVVDNGDGTYSQTFRLSVADVEADGVVTKNGAVCHYVNQMIFTGGLPSMPSFEYVDVTYTFNDKWEAICSDIEERYTAVMGISATCTSAYHTDYEYNTVKAVSTAYDDYFAGYASKPYIAPTEEKSIDALNCLTAAFSSVLTQPVVFDLSLDLNGVKTNGTVYVDVGSMTLETMELRLSLGSLNLWLDNGTAYLDYGGIKAKLAAEELTGLFGELLGGSEDSDDGEDMMDAMLSSLANGEFTVSESSATLASNLELLGLKIPVKFGFAIDAEKNVTLGKVEADIALKNLAVGSVRLGDLDIKATMKFGDKGLDALTAAQKEEYADLVPLVKDILGIFGESDVYEVTVNYAASGLRVDGDINLQIKGGVALSGALTVTLGEGSESVCKTLNFWFDGAAVYLELDGIKLKADIAEAVALIRSFLPQTTGDDGFDLTSAIAAVLSDDFANLLALGENEGNYTLVIKATEILKQFGFNVALGDVSIGVNETQITVGAMGAYVVFGSGKAVEEVGNKEEFIAILSYLDPVLDLFRSEAIEVGVSYASENLTVSGNAIIDLKALTVSATVTLRFDDGAQSVEKTFNAYYVFAEDTYGTLYLSLDGLKVRADINEALDLILGAIGKDMPAFDTGSLESLDIMSVLKTILAYDFSDYVKVEEQGDALRATVFGNTLLKELGVDFNLGDVVLELEQSGKLSVAVLGAVVEIQPGTAVALPDDLATYVDLGSVIGGVKDILDRKQIALSGVLALEYDGMQVTLDLNGAFKWETIEKADGTQSVAFDLYLDLLANISGTNVRLLMNVTNESVRIVYDNIGVEVVYSEFGDVIDALKELYHDVASAVNSYVDLGTGADGTPNKLITENIESVDDLLKMLGLSVALGDMSKEFDLIGLVDRIAVLESGEAGGIVKIVYGDLGLDILQGTDGAVLAVKLSYESEKIKLNGSFGAGVAETFPALPDTPINLGNTEFCELIDYVSAAFNTITADSFSIVFGAQLPAETTDENGNAVSVVNELTGSVEYSTGGNRAFTVYSTETNRSIVVSPELYLHVNLLYANNQKPDSDLRLEIYIFNYITGEADNVLDFFVTVSGKREGGNPLKLYATADEVMSLLSSAVVMLGIDSDILNEYLVSHWLDLKTVEDLRILGASLLDSFGVGDISSLLGGLGQSAVSEGEEPEESVGSFIQAIEFGQPDENGVSKFVFAWQGGVIELSKKKINSKSYLTGLGLGFGDVKVDAVIEPLSDVDTTGVVLDESYFKLEGIAKLLMLVSKSITVDSTEEGGAAFNKEIYCNGQIKLGISSSLVTNLTLTINVDAIAFVVDDNGDVAVNVRFSYSATKVKALGVVAITAINGDSTVNLTGKNGMVYIERTQTTDADGKAYAKPEVKHRAMPLTNFLSDMINQVGFLFNLGSSITDMLASASSGSGEGSALTFNDYGDLTDLLACNYTDRGDTSEYKLTVNGSKLLSGTATLGDIVVTIGTMRDAENEEVVRDLGIQTSLAAAGIIDLDVDAALALRNPRGIVDESIKDSYRDTWSDVAALLEEGMHHRLSELNAGGWEGVTFIEGQLSTLTYVINTESGTKVIKEQPIVVSTDCEGAADPKGLIYGDFSINAYPDLSDYDNVPGFTPQWTVIYTQNDALPENMLITAKYVPNEYRITLVSAFELEGFEKVGEVWEKTYNYVYGSALPEAANEIRYIAGYCDENGNPITASGVLGDMKLNVVWELVEYEISYYVDNVEYEFVANYGDSLEDIFTAPEKVGYTFSHWSLTVGGEAAGTVMGDTVCYAVYTPNEYTVVLRSEQTLEGFAAGNDGAYYKTVVYLYGENVALPIGEFETTVNGESKTMFLEGYTAEGKEGLLTSLAGIAENATLTAVWSEVKHKVHYFVNGTVYTSQNYNDSAALALPEVPEKYGYSGAWVTENGEAAQNGDLVKGDLNYYVAYTAVDYVVTVVSDYAAYGFVAGENGYTRTYTYTYDGDCVILETLPNISGFYFGGYYTKAGGKGVAVTELTNDILNTLTIYVYWIDNTVSVYLYSDLMYEGSSFDLLKDAYYTVVTLNDVYDISGYTYQVNGFLFLSWWICDNGVWSQIENVEYRDGAEIWALWVIAPKVAIDDVSKKGAIGFYTYSVSGSFTGGNAFGTMGTAIFESVGFNKIEDSTTVRYFVYRDKNQSYDALKWGEAIAVKYTDGVGTFSNSGMTSLTLGSFGSTADYGGAFVRITYSYVKDGKTITFGYLDDACMVSLDSYTVKFVDESGNTLKTVSGVRRDCAFDGVAYQGKGIYSEIVNFDNATYVKDIMPEGYVLANDSVSLDTAIVANTTIVCKRA